MTHLDVASSYHDAVHLLQGQLGGLRQLIFNEGKAFMFHCDWVPRQIHRFNGSKGQKGLSDGVFFDFKVYTSHIDSVNGKKEGLSKGLTLTFLPPI